MILAILILVVGAICARYYYQLGLQRGEVRGRIESSRSFLATMQRLSAEARNRG